MDQSLLHPVQRSGRPVRAVHRPSTLADALTVLASDPAIKPVAGGTDLLLDLHRGGPGDAVDLLDLSSVEGLDRIDTDDSSITLGATVTHNQVIRSADLRTSALPLAQACLEVASPQLRNRATVAGNIITASPANDTISALLALSATVTLTRVGGGNRDAGGGGKDAAGSADGSADRDSTSLDNRVVEIDDFFTGFRTTVIEPGELLTAITIPRMRAGSRGIWVKLGLRRAQAISVIHMALVVDLDLSGNVTSARVAAGSVAPRVVLLPSVSAALVGRPLNADSIAAAADAARDAIQPIDDVRATADYRKQTIHTVTSRALAALRDNRQADMWPANPPCLAGPVRAPYQESPSEPPAGIPSESPSEIPSVIDDSTPITVTVNGRSVTANGAASRNLLDWLRDRAAPAGNAEHPESLTGTKEGCAEGECGACTVRLDGQAVMSCMVPAAQAAGSAVVTVEGLAGRGADGGPESTESSTLHPIQQAFIDEFAVQCGFCIPGFLVSGSILIDEVGQPDDDQIKLGLSGNLCRCTGYYPIIEAVRSAGREAATEAGA